MIVRHTKMLQGTATSDKSPDTMVVKTGRYPGTGTAAQWSLTSSLSISRLSDIANVAIFLLSESKKSNIPFLFSCGSLSVYDGQNFEIDCYSRILIDEARFSRLNLIKLS